MANDQAPEFELKDQYDKSFFYRFPKSRVSVLIIGDRQGAEQVEGWVYPLYERYQDRIDIHGIAELSAVPTLARGLVRHFFLLQVKYSVMLDWTGEVARVYACQTGQANVILIAPDGRIITRALGPATPDSLSQVYEQIDQAL